jgi:protein-S-isoprenylcysteine O-methyltransferase Ste14
MHHPLYQASIALPWLLWLGCWVVMARGNKAVTRREPIGSRLTYYVPLLLGALLLARHDYPDTFLGGHFLPPPLRHPVFWVGAACVVFGLAFSVWARVHLAGNWSGTITLKEGHELIRTGPYRWVRHPIYTGVVLALLGTALAGARWSGLLGAGLMTGALIRKLSLEERWPAALFPEYAAYKAAVPALIPFIF